MQTRFKDKSICQEYLLGVPELLRKKGYLAASLDSLVLDSAAGRAWVYLGDAYRWKNLVLSPEVRKSLNLAGVNLNVDSGQLADFEKVEGFSERMLTYLENHGYPFAKVGLDSVQLEEEGVVAKLSIDKGPLYKLDSIRLFGNVRIKDHFLHKYLEMPAGSIYRKDKLDAVSRRILELPYARETKPWDLTMVGTGSTLNLYLEPKKSSQVNVLVGFLPDNSQVEGKLLVTGEANINLRNALGNGESIDVNWQQIQVKSPRLNLGYQQPYIFRSNLGFDFNFDLFKKDSSFLNLNTQIGLMYLLSAKQSGRIFFQQLTTNLLTIDTNFVKASKQLPQYLDVSTSNLGLDYRFNNTDYRFNPRKGTDLLLMLTAGLRRIKENSQITDMTKDFSGNEFDYGSLYDTLKKKVYILKLKATAMHYFRMGKQSTLKTGVQGGWIQTRDVFKNEIFQIGGYKLLRGFDEESIFATRYLVGTVEYRYLIGTNSFLFAFGDLGWSANTSYTEKNNHGYLGLGGGISFETRAGIFNLAYAVGKRDDLPFNLRQSKIHFGFVSLF
jgi:outer membrane protein assembly factor BamA